MTRMHVIMEKNKIKNSNSNPYRFLEKTKTELRDFLIAQKFPESWNIEQLKLAWAFQGLMNKKITEFDRKNGYAVYAYEPYITQNDSNKSLYEALLDAGSDLNLGRFYYDPNVKGHYAKVNKKLYTILTDKEITELNKLGKIIKNKERSSNYCLIIDLNLAIELVGHTKASYFRIISRIEARTDIYSALCAVFEITDDEQNYFPRDIFRSVFSDNGSLHKVAEEWLDQWVEDKDIKTHLSCFMEKEKGVGRKDIYLSSHYHEKWSDKLRLANKMPFGLDELHSIGNVNCILGWEWCYIDLLESKALIEIIR